MRRSSTPLESRPSPPLGSPHRTVTPIERSPRGTAEYEHKFGHLSDADKRIVTLAEESVLSDLARTHARRTMPDGTTFDLTAYDDFDVLLSFRTQADGRTEFIDFFIYEPT